MAAEPVVYRPGVEVVARDRGFAEGPVVLQRGGVAVVSIGWLSTKPTSPNDICIGPDGWVYCTDPTRPMGSNDGPPSRRLHLRHRRASSSTWFRSVRHRSTPNVALDADVTGSSEGTVLRAELGWKGLPLHPSARSPARRAQRCQTPVAAASSA
jgi:hypothetical protein